MTLKLKGLSITIKYSKVILTIILFITFIHKTNGQNESWTYKRLTVDQNLEISQNITIVENITVENKAILNVRGRLLMHRGSKIIVKRGAQLIIDGGTVTNACDEMWKGIEVWGTYNQPQSLVYQGLVRVQNGGKIENAYYGIRTVKAMDDQTGEGETLDMNYTGGIVWADNAEFINNKVSVRFYAYDNTSTSHFNNCTFQLLGDLLGGEQPDYMVKMSRMTGIVFTGCLFGRTDLENIFVGSGIYAYDSKFTVEGLCTSGDNPCTQWQGEFRQLKYGIYVINNSLSNKYPDIRHQYFSYNRSAVYIGTTDGARVTSNEFILPKAPLLTDKNYYGIYLDRSTKYHIEDNSFEGPNPDLGYIGVYINESGDSWNQIYNNTFSYLYYATLAYGDNRKGNETGLCIKCNDYDHNKNDITVNGKNSKYDGIAYNQGFLGPNDTLPAGNTFTQDQNILKYNFYNSENCGFVDYVFHGINNTTKWVDPISFYNTETMYKHPNNQAVYNKQISCPSKLEEPGGGGTGTDGDRQAITEADNHISQSKAQLQALVDGGNTTAVTLDVVTSTPPQGGEVYQNLLNKSPYLSDTVMKSAIAKENVLPNAMVRDVLVANPQSAKDKDVLNSLDERFDPMPQWMKDQILQGVSVTGAKESIEADIARWTSVREEHFNNIYRFYRKNMDDDPAYYDSLVILLDNENSLEAKYSLAFLYLDNGDANQATDLINSLPSQFDMTAAEQAVHQQYQNLFGILTQLDETGIPDSAQIAQLLLIEQNNQDYPGAFARSMLIEAGAIDYVEPVIIPDELKSSSAISNNRHSYGFETGEPLRVFPNPAKDYIIVDYDTQGKTGRVLLSVSDLKGNTVEKQPLNLNRDQRVINTAGWSKGVYIVTLMVNGTTVKSVKVTVQ